MSNNKGFTNLLNVYCPGEPDVASAASHTEEHTNIGGMSDPVNRWLR